MSGSSGGVQAGKIRPNRVDLEEVQEVSGYLGASSALVLCMRRGLKIYLEIAGAIISKGF